MSIAICESCGEALDTDEIPFVMDDEYGYVCEDCYHEIQFDRDRL